MKNILLVLLLTISTKVFASECPNFGEFECTESFSFSMIKNSNNTFTFTAENQTFNLKENIEVEESHSDKVTFSELSCTSNTFKVIQRVISNEDPNFSETRIFRFVLPRNYNHNYYKEVIDGQNQVLSRTTHFCQEKRK